MNQIHLDSPNCIRSAVFFMEATSFQNGIAKPRVPTHQLGSPSPVLGLAVEERARQGGLGNGTQNQAGFSKQGNLNNGFRVPLLDYPSVSLWPTNKNPTVF